jgi:hypothetical protein
MFEVRPAALQGRAALFATALPKKSSGPQRPKQARKRTRRFENSSDSNRAHLFEQYLPR